MIRKRNSMKKVCSHLLLQNEHPHFWMVKGAFPPLESQKVCCQLGHGKGAFLPLYDQRYITTIGGDAHLTFKGGNVALVCQRWEHTLDHQGWYVCLLRITPLNTKCI